MIPYGPVNATLGAQSAATVTIKDPPLAVAAVTPTLSGVVVEFNRAFDPSAINLYSAPGSGLGSADVTFKDAGTYFYICTPHPWMYGQVVVE